MAWGVTNPAAAKREKETSPEGYKKSTEKGYKKVNQYLSHECFFLQGSSWTNSFFLALPQSNLQM